MSTDVLTVKYQHRHAYSHQASSSLRASSTVCVSHCGAVRLVQIRLTELAERNERLEFSICTRLKREKKAHFSSNKTDTVTL